MENKPQENPSKIVDDDSQEKTCISPEHNPPMHIVIPQGKKLVHTCPSCKRTVTVFPPSITC